jgi:hypothetical protein
MHLVSISALRGMNADHILEWQDLPSGDTLPMLMLTMNASSENDAGQQQPYTITLVGEERLTMLDWLKRESDMGVSPPSMGQGGTQAQQTDYSDLTPT